MVVGYRLASVLVRAFWPAMTEPSYPGICMLGIAFLWLGMGDEWPDRHVGPPSTRPRAGGFGHARATHLGGTGLVDHRLLVGSA